MSPLAHISESVYLRTVAGDLLSKDKLLSVEALWTLGTLAVRQLQDHGVVTIFVGAEGEILVALPGELELDGTPEAIAIEALLERGYDEDQLISYLKGRDIRKERKGATRGKDL